LNHLWYAVGRIVEVKAYGDGEGFIPEYDVVKIVKREDPDAIFIYSNQYKFTNLDKITSIPKALKLGDPHANLPRHCVWCKENGVYPLSVFGDWIPKYEECFGKGNVGWLPYTIDHILYPNLKLEKTIDVFYTADKNESGQLHPIRYRLRETLPNHPEIISMSNVNNYIPEDKWVETLNQSRIFAFDASSWNYAVPKFYEGMSCGAVVMSTRPADAYKLHLIPDKTYIEVDVNNWFDKLQYYLSHKEELKVISENGYKVFRKYLCADVRAKELIDILTGLKNENTMV
jgi:glycosyltransferase involved in cell wall biosynthesis